MRRRPAAFLRAQGCTPSLCTTSTGGPVLSRYHSHMADQPLQPFAPPVGLSIHISAGAVGGWLFFIAFTFWSLYTLIACYHWVKYSHAAAVAYPAITLHLIVSAAIIL